MKGKWDAAKRQALKQGKATRQSAKQEPWRDRNREEEDGPVLLWGIHAVDAALRNKDRPFLKLWATDNAALRLAEAITGRGVNAEPVSPKELDQRLGPDTVHQGVLLEAGPLPDRNMADLAEAAVEGRPVVILDQVTDPHNVGAILRSAAVFGAAGLVMTRRHSAPVSGALAKAASGAADLVPVALVGNLARAMSELKAAGVTLIGLDGQGDKTLAETLIEDGAARQPLALVLGAEGRGLRQSTAESCDRICRIEADGPMKSLNVSNAAAVALHVALMGRTLPRV